MNRGPGSRTMTAGGRRRQHRPDAQPRWSAGSLLARCLLLLSAVLVLTPAHAQSEVDSEQLQQQLEAARQALDEAARNLAELNVRMFKEDAEGERSTRPMLGVLLAEEEFDRADGLKLVGVTPKGGAALAGLQAGDLIVAVNGHRLDADDSASHALHEAMSSVQAGDTVAVEFVRDGSVQLVDVTTQARGTFAMEVLGDMDVNIDLSGLESLKQLQTLQGLKGLEKLEALEALGELPGFVGMVEVSTTGGLELEDVKGDLARYFGVEEGVVVMAVPDDSMLKAGDVLLSLDGEAVASARTAMQALAAADNAIAAQVLREKQQLSLQIAAGTAGIGKPHVIRVHSGAMQTPDSTP